MRQFSHYLNLFGLGSVLLFCTSAFSQSCANYSVSLNTSITYTSIAGSGSNVFIWRNVSGGATNDDNRSILTNIGFDFWYLGVRYTSFSASTNGFVDFSNSTNVGTAGAAYGPLNGNEFSVGGTGGTMLTLAAFYNDLWPSSAGTAPLANSMVYKTTGTAPNRVLTVEWIGMEIYKGNPYWTSPPNANFQIKIYETSGKIEYVYGSMQQGNATHNYALGLNSFWTPAATPTASLHLTQQTVNTTSFSSTPQDALTTFPTSSTQLNFIPPAPSAAPSALSFSNVTKSSMELFWSDNASNELGYVILNSTDGVNYTFVNQLAANSTSASVTSLTAGTTYQWKVHAVTEGDLGSAATGTQATLASGTVISVATGNWMTPATWNCTCTPTSGDHVIVANGHVVTLDGNGECASLTVGQGTSGQLTLGNNATSRSLTVSGDLTVNSGATIINGASNATHQMTLTGNISNSGTLNLAATNNRRCDVTFIKDGTQSISGNGATTYFSRINMNMGNSISNILDISASTFSVRSTNFLTLNSGTFKLSAPAVTITPFTAATTLSTTCGIWLNHASAALTFSNSVTTSGNIRVSAGTMNVGNANNENLIINGGSVIIDGGDLIVAGRLARLGLTSLINFTLSSGNLILGNVGSTTANEAIFRNDEIGSSFNFSGGSFIVQRGGASNLGIVNTSTSNVSVTGGTTFISNASAPANQTITINSLVPFHDLHIGTGIAATASLLTNSLTVNNNLHINSGTLIANNLNISLSGNWLNSGVFTAGTSSVLFVGSNTQTISGVSTSTFQNLTISNSSSAGVICSAPIHVTGSLTLNNGLLNTDNTNILTLESTAGSSSGSNSSYVNGPMEKAGTTAFVFPLGKGGRWARLGIGAPSASTTFKAEYFNTAFTNSTSVASSPTPALNNVSKNEYWQLDQIAGSGNAQVTLYWENATFSGIDDCSAADLRVAHWNAGSSVWENNNDAVITTGACTGATPGSVTTSLQVSSFSPFTFGSLSPGFNPLPIELLNYQATLDKNGNVLNEWTTASEKNNDYFTIEKSQDGITFEKVGTVKGSGTTSKLHSYNLLDHQVAFGETYYRLKQTDFNQNVSYSKLISVFKKGHSDFTIFPNPNNGDNLLVKFEGTANETYELTIYTSIGKMALNKQIDLGNSSSLIPTLIPLEGKLEPGVYFVVVENSTTKSAQKLVISQK